MGTCNACLKPSDARVEVRTDTYRVIVCGACALETAAECAKSNKRCEIAAFVAPQISLFVASDHFYSRNPRDVDTHQRELDRRARAYAERVNAVVAQRASATPPARVVEYVDDSWMRTPSIGQELAARQRSFTPRRGR